MKTSGCLSQTVFCSQMWCLFSKSMKDHSESTITMFTFDPVHSVLSLSSACWYLCSCNDDPRSTYRISNAEAGAFVCACVCWQRVWCCLAGPLIYQWDWSLLCFNEQLCVVWHPCFHLPWRPVASRWQLSEAFHSFLEINSSHLTWLLLLFTGHVSVDGARNGQKGPLFRDDLSSQWVEYLLIWRNPPKTCWLTDSRVPFICSFSPVSLFLLNFHLGFPLVILLGKLEPICRKCWKLSETLVFVCVESRQRLLARKRPRV